MVRQGTFRFGGSSPGFQGPIAQSNGRAGNPTTQTTRPFDWLSSGPVPALASEAARASKTHTGSAVLPFPSLCALSRFTQDDPTAARQTEPYEHDPDETTPSGIQSSIHAPGERRGAEQREGRRAVCSVLKDSGGIPCAVLRYRLRAGLAVAFSGQFSLADPRKPPPTREPTREPTPPTHEAPHQPSRSLHRQMFYSCPTRPLLPKMPQLHHRQR